jgi:septal ring factor EnvC (AmiA/AmiB activator)
MIRWMGMLLLLLASVSATACVDRGPNLLDQELSLYRFEQEGYRRKDLEERYAEERQRCDELTERILVLRTEVDAKEAELSGLEARLRELTARIEEARAGLGAAEKPGGSKD